MDISDAVRALHDDLGAMFGSRLRTLIAYRAGSDGEGAAVPTLAVVDRITAGDLEACATRSAAWQAAGLSTPLLLARDEFGRSLDAFPLEFGAILADHVVVSGPNPFDGLRVDPADLRRACEVQARSHLLHLREGYIETGGRGDLIADLMRRSAAPLDALLKSVERLTGSIFERGGPLSQVAGLAGPGNFSPDQARTLFPAYLEGIERLTARIDQWPA